MLRHAYHIGCIRQRIRWILILTHTEAHEGAFVTLRAANKVFSIRFQPKWPPAISFFNLCHTSMFLTPYTLFAVPRLAAEERRGGKNTPILGLHSNSSQVTLCLTCTAESEKLRDGRGGWGEKRIAEGQKEAERDDTEKDGTQCPLLFSLMLAMWKAFMLTVLCHPNFTWSQSVCPEV